MGTDVAEDVETLQQSDEIKVHHLMCAELNRLVYRVSNILPEIEAARPRCSGIEALCSLTSALDKANSLLQQCRDSSKLYLALNGDAIFKRCIKSKNLLEQSLSQIQDMVPVMLAVKILRVIDDIKGARLRLDPSEMTAGKILKDLIYKNVSKSDVVEEIASQAIQDASLKLHISSQRDILIEKRSIRKLLAEVSTGDSGKKKILCFFLKLLEKYGKLIVEEQKKIGFKLENHFTDSDSSVRFTEVQSCVKQEPHGARFDTLSQSVPHEFICPISLKIMYAPVVIASGETFERMWIQKWFDEGNDTCPKTKKKLAHLTLTPNSSIKELISNWCSAHGVVVPDPNMRPLDFSCTSIASLTSSLNDLSLPMHFNSFSATLGSTSYSLNKMRTESGDDDDRLRFSSGVHGPVDENILKLDSLPFESQLSVVESMLILLNSDDHQLESFQYQGLIHPLLRFLKRAHDRHDVKCQTSGCLLLLSSVKKYSKCISYFDDDAYDLLASFINSNVIQEALLIWEALSRDELSRSRVGESSALVYILKMLESQTSEFHELLLSIICNVSEDGEFCSLLISAGIIPKLVPLLEDTCMAKYCARILKNMSQKEAAKVSILETYGCLASLARLLDSDNLEVQEHAVAVLLSLCSQRIEYCQRVMEECVIPGLCGICINGNDKGKIMATELLRLLKDEIHYSSDAECLESDPDPLITSINTKEPNSTKELKSSSNGRYLGKMMVMFKSSPISRRKKGEKRDR